MSDATIRGRFVWHELMTTDTRSAGAFFSKAIGWKTQPFDNDGSYTLFLAGPLQVAGLMVIPEDARKMGVPPSWLTYIGTPNVDETARQAQSLGGKVHKAPEDIPTVGRFAVLQDPQGATFGIYTPNHAPQPETSAGVRDFSWHELVTTDWRAALAFYQKLFGWETTSAMDMGDMGTYQMYGRNGRPLGGMMNKPKQMPGPPAWIPYIRVPDSKKTAETVKKLGGQIVNGPMEVPGGDWIAQGVDPQGAFFAVHSVNPAAATAAPAAPATKRAAGRKTAAKKVAAKSSAKKKPMKAARRPAGRKRAAVRKAATRKPAKAAKRAVKKSKGTTRRKNRAGKKR